MDPGLLIAATLGQLFASEEVVLRPMVTVRSLIVSYSLGMLVTFGTVLFSANRVSRLNIVAAIRDLPEPPPPPKRLRDRLLAPFGMIAAGFRHLRRRQIRRALWAWAVTFPRSLFGVVWAGFLGGPLTLLLGLALVPVGVQTANGSLL